MSGLNSSFTPQEPPLVLFDERAWLQGAILSSVAYGVTLTLFFLCLQVLVRQTTRATWQQQLPFIIYISVMFLLGTLFMGSLAKFTQLAFIDNRNFPGGPSAFEQVEFSIPVDELGNVSFVLSNWLADMLMVWRYRVIYKDCRYPLWLIMVFPYLLFLSSFATGLLWLLQISASSPFSSSSINWTLPYLSLSLALNIVLTVAIVLRLLVFRHRISKALGPLYGSQYTSVVAMIVESASLFSAFALLFLIPFALNSPLSKVFLQVLSQVQIIAPLMIVLRVAEGKGWSGNMRAQVMNSNPTPSTPTEKLSTVQFRNLNSTCTITTLQEQEAAQAAVKHTQKMFQRKDGAERKAGDDPSRLA